MGVSLEFHEFKVFDPTNEEDMGKTMGVRACDGGWQLGQIRKKTQSFIPVGQHVFPNPGAAVRWAFNRWLCGEKFE